MWVYCAAGISRNCYHSAPMALAPVIIRWGADASSNAAEGALYRLRLQGGDTDASQHARDQQCVAVPSWPEPVALARLLPVRAPMFGFPDDPVSTEIFQTRGRVSLPTVDDAARLGIEVRKLPLR